MGILHGKNRGQRIRRLLDRTRSGHGRGGQRAPQSQAQLTPSILNPHIRREAR
jgi:hypothetical protein